MKKRRLNKLGKTVLTILVLISSILVYSSTSFVGSLAQNSNIWLSICCLEWVYLFFIQFCLYSLIWEN